MRKSETEGVVAWVTGENLASRELLAATAAEFKLDLRLCGLAEVLGVLRAERCELVGIEIDADRHGAMRLLKEIRERLPRVTVFAASADTSVATIRSALEAGASEVLSLPLTPQELSKAFIKFTQVGHATAAAVPAHPGEVFAIYGARGGLGVTTLAVNLAVRIGSVADASVALVDLDLQRGDVAAFLNLTPLQSLATISAARGEVDEIFLHGTMTRHPSGVHVLPAPVQIEEADVVSQEDVALVLDLLRTQFRYVVIDTPRAINGPCLAALENADRVLVLTDLSVPGVRSAQRTVELLARLGVPSTRVDLLVTDSAGGPVALKDAVRAIGKEPLLTIPRDESAARDAMNAGAPLNGAAKPSGLSMAIGELAGKLVGGVQPKAKRGTLLSRIFARETSR